MENLGENSKVENYDHVELTQEESEKAIAEALRLARHKKHLENESKEYWKKINEEKVYPKYNAEQLAVIVHQRFLNRTGNKLIIDHDNKTIFRMLCLYFSGDELFESEFPDLNLDKGILLQGGVGVGKTELIKCFTQNHVQSFGIISCRFVVDEFLSTGVDAVERFFNNPAIAPPHPFGHTNHGWCFDDLGTEAPSVQHFGNKKNLMAEIILNRYDKQLDFKTTHITTNLSIEEIGNLYGTRAKDRLNQMFNQITFDPNCKSRR